MGTPAHRPLVAGFPQAATRFQSSRRGSAETRASRPVRACVAAGLCDRRDPSTPGASRPPLRMTKLVRSMDTPAHRPLTAAFQQAAASLRSRRRRRRSAPISVWHPAPCRRTPTPSASCAPYAAACASAAGIASRGPNAAHRLDSCRFFRRILARFSTYAADPSPTSHLTKTQPPF